MTSYLTCSVFGSGKVTEIHVMNRSSCLLFLSQLAILYELLYEKVFGIDVGKTLEELIPPDTTKDGSRSCEGSDSEDENIE